MNDQGELSFDGEDGLAQWRASIPPASQPDLQLQQDESGYQHWKDQQQKLRHAFEKRHAITLDHRVRVSLTFLEKDVEGRIIFKLDEKGKAILRIGSLTFTPPGHRADHPH